MRLSIARQLLGQSGSEHALVIKEPVDAETSQHNTDEAHQLESNRIPQRFSATETIFPPELVFGMELELNISLIIVTVNHIHQLVLPGH